MKTILKFFLAGASTLNGIFVNIVAVSAVSASAEEQPDQWSNCFPAQ